MKEKLIIVTKAKIFPASLHEAIEQMLRTRNVNIWNWKCKRNTEIGISDIAIPIYRQLKMTSADKIYRNPNMTLQRKYKKVKPKPTPS